MIMVKLDIYSPKGIKKGSTNLPKDFVDKENLVLLAQAIRVYEDKKHPGLAKTKTRGEVAVSKRKIYRQKGTGGARHGSRNAPIFVGGGVAHGPRGLKKNLSLPKKIARTALGIALTLKSKEGKLVVLDQAESFKKTKDIALFLGKISEKLKIQGEKKHFTLVLAEENKKVAKIAKNIPNLKMVYFKDLNAATVFWGGIIVIDQKALAKEKGGKKNEEKDTLKKGLKGEESRSRKKTKEEKINGKA